MTPDQTNRLLARLTQSEDPWVERKQSYNEQEVRRTVVGFANSVGEGQTAVMFIGADNKGQHKGVSDADETQRKISGILQRCYPPIAYQTCVLPVAVEGKPLEIVAILVPFSKDRPHFAGLAAKQIGGIKSFQSASQEAFLHGNCLFSAAQSQGQRRCLQS